MRPDAIARERARSRTPILESEVPYLEAFGRELLQARESLGLARSSVAELALINSEHLARLELGTRRTRRSTLERIVAAMVELAHEEDAEGLDPDAMVARMVEVAGPVLAAESPYAARLLRRAKRRQRLRNLAYIRAARDAQ